MRMRETSQRVVQYYIMNAISVCKFIMKSGSRRRTTAGTGEWMAKRKMLSNDPTVDWVLTHKCPA